MHPFVFTVLVIVAAVKAGKLMELIIFFIIVSQLITFFFLMVVGLFQTNNVTCAATRPRYQLATTFGVR